MKSLFPHSLAVSRDKILSDLVLLPYIPLYKQYIQYILHVKLQIINALQEKPRRGLKGRQTGLAA